MKVTIHYIRHAESDANVLQHQMVCGDIRHLFLRDPGLSKTGENTTKNLHQALPPVDIVLSSQLLRAIQTALYSYPKRFIHTIPILNELGGGLDNIPYDIDEQKNILKEDFHRVIFTDNDNERNVFAYIKKYILPRFKNKDALAIAIFTHSRFMKKHLQLTMEELPNNVMITKEYKL
tara:strand:- start:326 stop:856 length:531 start_codon:yes stop_codon:yes gene_type:complete